MQLISLSLRYSPLLMSNKAMMQRCYESEKYSVYDRGKKMKQRSFQKDQQKKREYTDSCNKDQKHSRGLNGHETRGAWTSPVITASDSSRSLPRAEASRKNDVVSYRVQQDSVFIGSVQPRLIYAAFLLLCLYTVLCDLRSWTPLTVWIVLQAYFRFMFLGIFYAQLFLMWCYNTTDNFSDIPQFRHNFVGLCFE